MASFEEDIFTALKANWTADSTHRWGSNSAEGTPKVVAVERWGSDAMPSPPAVMIKVLPRHTPTCGGTKRWSGIAELLLRLNPNLAMPSTNYAGHRDVIVSRIIAQLDDQTLAAGTSHTFGRPQLIGTPQQNRAGDTIIRFAVDGEET